jgi:hypothetical protein
MNLYRRRPFVVLPALVMGILSLGLDWAWSQTEILEPSDAPAVIPAVEQEVITIQAPSAPLSLDSLDSTAAPAEVAPAIPESTQVPTLSQPASKPLEGGFTIEVDKSLGKNSDKNLAWALLASAVLPGSGEIYLREPKQGEGFLLAEVGFWGVLLMSLWSQEAYLQSARNQASEYAGIDASGKGIGFLNTMSEYRSYLEKEHRNDSYEMAQILSGKRNGQYDIPANPENFWDFGSSNTPENTQHWKSFQSSLRYYRASKVVFTFALGGIALNRVVALAHTLRLYRRTANQSVSWHVFPILGPGSGGGLVALSF